MCAPTDNASSRKDGASTTRRRKHPDRLDTGPATKDTNSLSAPSAADTNGPNGVFSFPIASAALVVVMSVVMLEFSMWFPFNIPGVTHAAAVTYVPAAYEYDSEHTQFDNTYWTYGTDYLLVVVMTILAVRCLLAKAPDGDAAKNKASLRLRLYSAALLLCYAISTFAGGYAHQTFTDLESLNTTPFRFVWIICVGNVSFASCYMGLIGREVQQAFGVQNAMPLGFWWFWPMYGAYITVACAMGYFSYKRPACDIFIAGTSQFPSTIYCMLALGLRQWPSWTKGQKDGVSKSCVDRVHLVYRVMFYVGFIGNSPLLPMYPILVQNTNMTLAGINTLLHSWLLVTWGMQGLSLHHLCRAVSASDTKSLIS